MIISQNKLFLFLGLAVVSRFPFLEIEFTMFNVTGPLGDGEKLARKGNFMLSWKTISH